MKQKVADLLNAQVNKEFYSAYLYLGISKYFTKAKLYGFANWYRVQATEEQEHAMKIYDYLLDSKQDVCLEAIDKVDIKFDSALEAVKEADKHEQYITAEICKIMDLAIAENDYSTQSFLDWFIEEQKEEEENSRKMISMVEAVGGDKRLIYKLDKEIEKRE